MHAGICMDHVSWFAHSHPGLPLRSQHNDFKVPLFLLESVLACVINSHSRYGNKGEK